MVAKATAPAAAQKRPASPMHDSDDSTATQATKKRRQRRPALSNDEDIAILRAVLAVQPYRAGWGQGRQKWLETAARVVADTGGEMSDDLCKGRYVNLLKRFATPQEERKRAWPKDEELKALLEEAVAEQTKYENEVKDEFDEKGNQRRKWQPLLAMRKAPAAAAAEKSEKGDAPDASPARKGAQKGSSKARGVGEKHKDKGKEKERAVSATTDSEDSSRRPTRWTAPTPGARAPVLSPPALSASAAAVTSQASALASRAVASATSSRVVLSPARQTQPPASSAASVPPPILGTTATATFPSKPFSPGSPVRSRVVFSSGRLTQPILGTTAIATSDLKPRTVHLGPYPGASPAILRGPGSSRETPAPGRQQHVQLPAPWLRQAGAERETPPTNTEAPRSTAAPGAPTPRTSTPPQDGKPDLNPTPNASAPRPSSASPREQPPVDQSRVDRGYSTFRESARQNHENQESGRHQPQASLQVRSDTANGVPARASTPPRQPLVQQPPPQSFTAQRSGVVQPPGRFALSQNRHSHAMQPSPPAAPANLSSIRDNSQFTPPRSAPASQATSLAPSTNTNTSTSARDGSTTSNSRSQTSESRTGPSTVPRVNGATGLESMLLCVLDRLTDMEKARLEDTRAERELKRRELETGAQRNRSSLAGASSGSSSSLRNEFDELNRTTTSLATSFAASRQEQQDLQLEVSRLAPYLQASQRERSELQQDVSLLTTQLKSANREREELKSDLAAVVKTVKLLQTALLQHDEAFEHYKREEALGRQREYTLQQEIVTRQLEQFQGVVQEDQRKREEVLTLIQKERDLNVAQHRERLRQLDARGGTGTGKARTAVDSTSVPASVEAELAELRVAIDVERSEREREYTTLLENIKQILAADESG